MIATTDVNWLVASLILSIRIGTCALCEDLSSGDIRK
jgi:hypothetical protein